MDARLFSSMPSLTTDDEACAFLRQGRDELVGAILVSLYGIKRQQDMGILDALEYVIKSDLRAMGEQVD